MNSVAGVLKLYFRELKDPLFPREMFDAFTNCMRTSMLKLYWRQKNQFFAFLKAPECETADQQEIQKIENLKKIISTVPNQIFIVMRYLFAFLNQ
jgi:SLIT-ROBO Rho GTPase activating protein